MNLYIETENGAAKNHPALESNLLQSLGEIPAHWEPFVRVDRPLCTLYQTIGNHVYEKVDGVWTDVWTVRDMTAEEKSATQQVVKDAWATRPNAENFVAWIFDEATCTYKPPIPRPTDRPVFWHGATSAWVTQPAYPTDGKLYRLDFTSATWVEVTQ